MNVQTIKVAIKEAQAAEIADDATIYSAAATGITVQDVATSKELKDTFDPVIYKNNTYTPVWSHDRVYFANGSTTIDGVTLPSSTALSATLTTYVSALT